VESVTSVRDVNRRRLVLGAAVVAVVGAGVAAGAVVAGGSGDGSAGSDAPDRDGPRVVQPGAPGEESRELSEEELADIEAPRHTDADVRFMQDMILHHRQALEMTALVEDRTESDDIPLLASRITISQEAEIELMEQWLDDRAEEVPDDGAGRGQHDHGGLMPGMLTDDQLQELSRARGSAFDRLFLERMITHHQGALRMVDDLYAAGGGLEPAADRFARDAVADQSIEIGRMQDLLAGHP
jgi:uncharacterized protein (DUF305 family)